MRSDSLSQVRETIWAYYAQHNRKLPWRELSNNLETRFYEVLVSEIMLQQTQVGRVMDKYAQWMQTFPTMKQAANAPLRDILYVWQGLGYNRRGKYLQDACQYFSCHALPQTVEELVLQKGIGANTAAAILAYYLNQPVVFIETNIRTILLHHFFRDQLKVDDSQLRQKLEKLADFSRPRDWYWAMMDYGTYLKSQVYTNHQSKHYRKQSMFEGSQRQKRARLLRALLASSLERAEALQIVSGSEEIIDSLIHDELVTQTGSTLSIKDEA